MTKQSIEVLYERCMGAGNCAEVAPHYFDQDPADGTVIVLESDVVSGDAPLVSKAAAVCPVAAILLNEG
jgi:ferredoxin